MSCHSTFGPFLNNLQRATLALLGRAHLQQRPDGVDRRPLFADDFADVGGMHAQFINGYALLLDWNDVDGIGPVHQAFDDVFEEGLHKAKSALGGDGGGGGGSSGGGGGGFSSLANEAGHRVAWLRAFADPILRPLVVQGEIVALLQWLISADLLDELPVARAATVRDHDPEHGVVLRPDSFHPYSDCHKSKLKLRRPKMILSACAFSDAASKRGVRLFTAFRVGKPRFWLFSNSEGCVQALEAKMRVPSAIDLWLNELMKITIASRRSAALWFLGWLTVFVFVLPASAQIGQLAPGV